MLTVLSPRFKAIILFIAMLLGVSVTSFSHADTNEAIQSCFNYLKTQDYYRAETAARQLLKSPNLPRVEQRYAQLCLGRAYDNAGKARDALPSFLQVETLSQTTEELAIAYSSLGGVYLALHDLDRAELYDQRALKLFNELGNKSNEASALNNLALVLNYKGAVERALSLYQEAVLIEPNEAAKPAALNNISAIYLKQKNYTKADQLLRQSLDISQRNGNAHEVAITHLKIGASLRQQGKLDDAEKELLAGLTAIRLLGDKSWEANGCARLGRLAEDQNKLSIARDWYVKAAAIYRAIGDTNNANQNAEDAAALGQ